MYFILHYIFAEFVITVFLLISIHFNLSSSDNEESSVEDSSIITTDMTASKESSVERVTFQALFPSMKQVYGMELTPPKRADLLLYKK